MKGKYFYMEVTTDHLELPLAVAESAEELSRLRGVTSGVVFKAIENAEKKGIRSKYVRVRKDEDSA